MTLVKEADARFGAGERGGWYDAEGGATPFARSVTLDDSVEPSGTAVLLEVRIALGALTLEESLTSVVDSCLRARANELRANGMESAGWLDAALLRVGPYYDVVVAGDDDVAVERLEHVSRALGASWVVSARVATRGPDAPFERLVVASRGKTGWGPLRGRSCVWRGLQDPTTEPTDLRATLLRGWKL